MLVKTNVLLLISLTFLSIIYIRSFFNDWKQGYGWKNSSFSTSQKPSGESCCCITKDAQSLTDHQYCNQCEIPPIRVVLYAYCSKKYSASLPILEDSLLLLKNSGMIGSPEVQIYLVLNGDPLSLLKASSIYSHFNISASHIFIHIEQTPTYEYWGLKTLQDLAQKDPDRNSLYLYFHTKGITHLSEDEYRAYPYEGMIQRTHLHITISKVLAFSLIVQWRKVANLFRCAPKTNLVCLLRDDWRKNRDFRFKQESNRLSTFPYWNYYWARRDVLANAVPVRLGVPRHWYESWLGEGDEIPNMFSIHEKSYNLTSMPNRHFYWFPDRLRKRRPKKFWVAKKGRNQTWAEFGKYWCEKEINHKWCLQ